MDAECNDDIKVESRKGYKRESWSNRTEYLLSLIGYAVGFANILRFPYLTMVNGGGAFLIPYFSCMFLCAMPLYFIELYMGQNTRRSCITCWDKFAPIFKGVGYGQVWISELCILINQGAVTWILYYLGMSFSWTLPWTSCNSTWNTENCVLTIDALGAATTNITSEYTTEATRTMSNTSIMSNTSDMSTVTKPMTASEEYWQYHVLDLSSGFTDLGGLRWQLVVPHLLGWVAIYVCIIQGVKTVGKVVWLTALLPYILLIIFIIRLSFLPGSVDGIILFLTPDFDKLANPQVWITAFLQIFNSLGTGWGAILTMASYNKYHSNFTTEAILAPFFCCFASFLCGFVVFSVSGYLAYTSGVPILEAVKAGPGLAFISYPEAAAQMPGGAIWAVLFFTMLFMVALDTQFVAVEVCVTAIRDELKLGPKMQKYVLAATIFFNIFIGLVFCSRAGMYIFQILDWYYAIIGSFVFAIVECLILIWVYNYKRMYDEIYAMTGKRPLQYILVPLWGAVIPFLLFSSMIWTIVRLKRPKYGDYVYPEWAAGVGWMVTFTSLVPLVLGVVIKVISIMVTKPSDKWRRELWRSVKPKVDYETEQDLNLALQNNT